MMIGPLKLTTKSTTFSVEQEITTNSFVKIFIYYVQFSYNKRKEKWRLQ